MQLSVLANNASLYKKRDWEAGLLTPKAIDHFLGFKMILFCCLF